MNRKHRPRSAAQKDRSSGPRTAKNDLWIYGHHAVAAALNNHNRQCHLLMATSDALRELERHLNLATDLTIEKAERQAIERRLPAGAVHQGLALQADPLPDLDLATVCAKKDLVVVLDQVSDPHNVGAILRSAAAFGAAAVILQDRHSPGATGALAKSASGALEKMPLVRVVNLARALDELKRLGFWIVGLDADAPATLDNLDPGAPVALVLGAEGAGLRRLSREACDIIASLPHTGGMASLNVSNAAAVALFALRSIMARGQDGP